MYQGITGKIFSLHVIGPKVPRQIYQGLSDKKDPKRHMR